MTVFPIYRQLFGSVKLHAFFTCFFLEKKKNTFFNPILKPFNWYAFGSLRIQHYRYIIEYVIPYIHICIRGGIHSEKWYATNSLYIYIYNGGTRKRNSLKKSLVGAALPSPISLFHLPIYNIGFQIHPNFFMRTTRIIEFKGETY